MYHPWWVESVTLALHKISTLSYDVAKAYCPIGLIDAIPKVFLMLFSKHISFLAQKHGILPPTKFSSRLGRNTMDTMLLVTHKIKDTWRRDKTAAALFQDVQGAFLNMVKEQLVHNMHMQQVPECFINIVNVSLTGRTMHLKFDDFVSEPVLLNNGTTQGDPSSMFYYTFYNVLLIEVASSSNKLSSGFVDDSMMLAIGDTIEECHVKLKDMMERPGGGFEWSYTHNSPFELSNTTLMNLPRSFRDHILEGLTLDKPNADRTITPSVVLPVLSYKYLPVLFDLKLC